MRFYDGKLNHLWVDLFILDRLPRWKRRPPGQNSCRRLFTAWLVAHRNGLDFSKYSLADKIRVGVLAMAGRLIPMPVLFKLQRLAAMKDADKRQKRWYYSNYQPDYLYVTLEGEWCEKTLDMEFENLELMAPIGFTHVLELIYGDYRKLPPPEKRVQPIRQIEIQIYDQEK